MITNTENPYANYRINDWNWEFIKRNPRYIRLYKAVRRLKTWLRKKSRVPTACFTIFGMLFRFERSDRGNGWEWVYRGKANNPIYLNDFASPTNPSSRRYTGKLIKKLQAVTAIDGSVDRVGNGCATARLQEHEIALQIDTRFTRQEIVSAVEKLLKTIQPKKKLHVKKYRDYLAVWDLRKEGRTLKEIAEMVWPDKYKTKGGSNYPGEKWVLIQRASDHEEAAKKLIDSSFPSKKYR